MFIKTTKREINFIGTIKIMQTQNLRRFEKTYIINCKTKKINFYLKIIKR